jgi:uncharacterized membrane protein
MPPPPPELAGWIDFVVWGAILFILVIIAVAVAEYVLGWLRSPQPTQARARPATASTYDGEVLRELLQEMRALREEIRELRRELKE